DICPKSWPVDDPIGGELCIIGGGRGLEENDVQVGSDGNIYALVSLGGDLRLYTMPPDAGTVPVDGPIAEDFDLIDQLASTARFVISDDGVFHVVYYHDGELTLRYAVGCPGGKWTIETIALHSDTTPGKDANLTLDTSGHPRVVWYGGENNDLLYSVRSAGKGWTTESILDFPNEAEPEFYTGNYSDIAVDANGVAHVTTISSYSGSDGYLWYGNDGSGTWAFEQLDGWRIFATDIEIASDGNPAIAYVDISDFNNLTKLRYAKRDASGGWTIAIVDSLWFSIDLNIYLRFSNDGEPMINFLELTSLDKALLHEWVKSGDQWFDNALYEWEDDDPNHFQYAFSDDGLVAVYDDYILGPKMYRRVSGDNIVNRLTMQNSTSRSSMDIDANGNVYIVYRNRYKEMHLVKSAGGIWSDEIVPIENDDFFTTEIAIETPGNPQIMYRARDNEGNLRVYHLIRVGGVWAASAIGESVIVDPSEARLALDTDESPRVLVRDYFLKEIYIAYWDSVNVVWDLELVDIPFMLDPSELFVTSDGKNRFLMY
ncbi:MAG: hypothetical protein K8H84_07235, partial [Sulfuricella denitrificans]|nr:hypothetical protein [Sulfuricella denitrificans]